MLGLERQEIEGGLSEQLKIELQSKKIIYQFSFVYSRRKYSEKLDLYAFKPLIKVLTGMRRVGKSTLLKFAGVITFFYQKQFFIRQAWLFGEARGVLLEERAFWLWNIGF